MKNKKQPSTHQQLDFYEVFWIFVFGGIFGYFYEGLLFLHYTHAWQANTGVIYGAFNQIYGFGAVFMLLILYQLRKQPTWLIFIISALLGGIYEYSASLIQEQIFGYVSWNYLNLPLNIGGRTTIPYMILWGLLGIVLLKIIYPLFQQLGQHFSFDTVRFVTVIVLILLAFDLTCSSLAVWRMQARDHQKPATSVLDRYLDDEYPDQRLKKIYPNMQTFHP